MEQTDVIMPVQPMQVEQITIVETEESKQKHFIEANTIMGSLQKIKECHIIPVFSNNETLISHGDFIDAMVEVTSDLFAGEIILQPEVRLSHPVMGRTPDAAHKTVAELAEWEKTLYYQRMAFIIEIPSIQSNVNGNMLSLTVGGVRSFAEENLYSRSVCDQHFKFFIGFKNTVCCNLCAWTDGYMGDVKVRNVGQLKACIKTLLESYNKNFHLHHLSALPEYSLTENQFAQLIGKIKMYQHLPSIAKRGINPIVFGDQQMANVVKDYYKDDSFCRDAQGNINLWRFYNLLTNANKSSYIDSFLEKSVAAYSFTEHIRWALEGKHDSWYLN